MQKRSKKILISISILTVGVMLFMFFSFLKFFRIIPDIRGDWKFIQSVGGIKLGESKSIGLDAWKVAKGQPELTLPQYTSKRLNPLFLGIG